MNELEILLRIKTEGEAQLARIKSALGVTKGEVASSSQTLKEYDSSFQRVGNSASRASDLIAQSAAKGNSAISAMTSLLGKATGSASGFALATVGIGSAFGVATAAAYGFLAPIAAGAKGLTDFAARAGLSLATADRLSASARLAGVNVGSLEGASRSLAQTLEGSSAASFRNRDALRELGVAVDNQDGSQRKLEAVFLDTVKALSGVKDETQRVALANQVLGGSAQEILPLINKFQDLDRTVRNLGYGTRDELIRSLTEADRKFAELGLSWDVLKGKLAEPIAAVVNFVVRPSGINQFAKGGTPVFTGAEAARSELQSIVNSTIKPPAQDPIVGELARGFRASQSGTEDGLKRQLDAVVKRRRDLEGQLSGNDLGRQAWDRAKAEFDRLSNEETQLQERLKALGKKVTSTDTQFRSLIESLNERNLDPLASLFASTQRRLTGVVSKTGTLSAAEVDEATNALQGAVRRQLEARREIVATTKSDLTAQSLDLLGSLRSSLVPQVRSVTVDPEIAQRRLVDLGTRRLRAVQDTARFEERITQLQAGPGGQLAAIQRVAAIRVDAAQREYQIAVETANTTLEGVERELALVAARAELQAGVDRARKERVIEIGELQRQQIAEVRDSAGQVFDALVTRGTAGVRDLALGQLRVAGRTIFQNTSEVLFSSVKPTLGGLIGGQFGPNGQPTMLGKLLSGTFLAGERVRPIESRQLLAAERTASAVEILASRSTLDPAAGLPGPVGIPGGSTLSDALRVFGSDTSGLTGTRGRSRILGALGGVLGGLSVPLSTNPLGVIFTPSGQSVQTGPGTANTFSTSQRVGAAIGTAGALAGGALGVRSGIQQGGFSGALTGVAAAAGTAAVLSPEPISKAILAGVALAAGTLGSLLPDPREKKDRLLTSYFRENAFTEPSPISRFEGTSGREIDYDYRGQVRAGGTVIVKIDALDARSVMDRRQELADVIRAAVTMDGHALMDDIRRAAVAP